ncbi:3-oxoacyl-ACP reductase FabG [Planococcus halotolerans]|uniref:3-oxoacyl-[acyl-carrier-protein] reductase n=1 Tax=Planococcus halotolerans TaxID=2233542 RepID=A0A365L2K2_9BACL|nr:3-oxoacyl-ACP reductase FabG [Planococcus halotolerans]RAZ79681.1 3-oxoacyl-[acyl-carrier-protein] reductase [Planococcus halotolerans]
MVYLQSKVAVVTGAAQGIGAAIVERFVAEGVKVAALDVNGDKLRERWQTAGDQVVAFECDVTDGELVKRVFEEIYSRFEKIDILVNNAGITRDAIFHKMTEAQWHSVMDVNLTSMFHTCQAVIPAMRKQEYGKIVNISSVSSWGNAGQANYSASKAGVLGFTKTLAKENGGKNITVNAIAPGQIDTEMTKDLPENIQMMALMLTPAGRLGDTSEVASVARFLASDDSSFVNGECIQVNGGFLMV